MTATFAYSSELAQRGMEKLKAGSSSGATLKGEELAHAQMRTLLAAEFLAADVGAVPWVPVGGDKGILVVGGARDRIEAASPEAWAKNGPAFTAYLGAHGAIRKSVSRLRSPIGAAHDGLGVLPLAAVVSLTVLGVASLVAGAWYLKEAHGQDVEVKRQEAKDIVASNMILESLRSEIATRGEISSEGWKALSGFAKDERKAGSGLDLVTIPVAVALGAGALWAYQSFAHGGSHG